MLEGHLMVITWHPYFRVKANNFIAQILCFGCSCCTTCQLDTGKSISKKIWTQNLISQTNFTHVKKQLIAANDKWSNLLPSRFLKPTDQSGDWKQATNLKRCLWSQRAQRRSVAGGPQVHSTAHHRPVTGHRVRSRLASLVITPLIPNYFISSLF